MVSLMQCLLFRADKLKEMRKKLVRECGKENILGFLTRAVFDQNMQEEIY